MYLKIDKTIIYKDILRYNKNKEVFMGIGGVGGGGIGGIGASPSADPEAYMARSQLENMSGLVDHIHTAISLSPIPWDSVRETWTR